MKKGFTLIEMLGVILILSLLIVIGNIAISSLIKNSKVKLSEAQIEIIKKAAESLASDNILYLPSENKCKYITLDELYDYDYFSNEVINISNNQAYSDIYVSVCASLNNKALIYNYEIGYLDELDRPEPGMTPFFLSE